MTLVGWRCSIQDALQGLGCVRARCMLLQCTLKECHISACEAHGQGAVLQYGYLKAKGAFAWSEAAGRYVIDPAKMETGLRDLLHDQLMLQATGDYAGTKAFFAKWAVLDTHAEAAFAAMGDIPVDVLPVYPKRI